MNTKSEDEVKVVRCKDCYYYGISKEAQPCGFEPEKWCRILLRGMEENDFCSHGYSNWRRKYAE